MPATALLLRFSDGSKATGYYKGYQDRMKACGDGGELRVRQLWSSETAAAAVRLYGDDQAEVYAEVAVVRGSTVALLAAFSTSPDSAASWARGVVPVLEAVVDA